MLLILGEVSVNEYGAMKVTYWSMTVTDCSHRAITIQSIMVKVLVKLARWSTTVTD